LTPYILAKFGRGRLNNNGEWLARIRYVWDWSSFDSPEVYQQSTGNQHYWIMQWMLCSMQNHPRVYLWWSHPHITILWLSGFCLGQPGWASTRRDIHSLTPIMVISHPLSASSIYYDPWHPPCSIYVSDSLCWSH